MLLICYLFGSAKTYNLVFFLLGYEYLRALKLPLELSDKTNKIFFISSSDEKILPSETNIFIVKTTFVVH